MMIGSNHASHPLARTLALAALALAGAAQAQTPAASGEPSEADMRAAYERRLGGVNKYMGQTADQCRRGEYKRAPGAPQGDMALAIQCLAIAGTGSAAPGGAPGTAAPSMQATNFRKIACEKAQGEAGYWCDYTAGIAMNMPMLPRSMSSMMEQGAVSQARFVRTDNGWLMLPNKVR